MPGSGCDHRCRHLRSWPDRVRGEWVAFRRRVGGGYERIGGFGRHADDHEYTRVIPDASKLADTRAFRDR